MVHTSSFLILLSRCLYDAPREDNTWKGVDFLISPIVTLHQSQVAWAVTSDAGVGLGRNQA